MSAGASNSASADPFDALLAAGLAPGEAALIQDEITFITGVDEEGLVAPETFWTWNGQDDAGYRDRSSAVKHGDPEPGTPGGTVEFFFDPAANWTDAEEQAFKSGFALWEAVADIQFEETSDESAADVVITRGTDRSAYTSQPTARVDVGSDDVATPLNGALISIDTRIPGWKELGDFSYSGGYAVTTVVHEIGHLIGLGHAGPYNGNVGASTQQFGPYDNRAWSIMSYIDPDQRNALFFDDYVLTGTDWNNNNATTWMPMDILAVQQLYGEATDTPLSGGQTFGFNCNITGDIQPFFDFTINADPVITIWSAGANNTLDLSGFDSDAVIYLDDGLYSSCGGMVNNIAIAYGTIVETAIAGAGDDKVAGNDYDNLLDGGAGDDDLFGDYGDDRLFGRDGEDSVYGDLGDDLVNGGRGADWIEGGEGNDIVLMGGGRDTVAVAPSDDFDIVVGYRPGADSFDLSEIDRFNSFDDLRLIEVGNGVLVNYGPDMMLLTNTDIDSLNADDFIFA